MAYDEQLAERVRGRLLARDGYSERKMFGGICFMINGNMSCGVVNEDLMLRLNPELAADALKDPNVREMDFTGRPMKGMVYVSREGWDADLHKWVDLAGDFAASLPAKQPKKKK